MGGTSRWTYIIQAQRFHDTGAIGLKGEHMKIEEGSLTPLYQQVMEDIRDKVDSGKFVPGDKIPSEPELSEEYSVSRITIRRAVSELVDDGYLVKRQGKGTFVCQRKLTRKICQKSEVQSFTDTCAEDGRVAGAKVLGVETVRARESEASFLGLQEGAELVHVRRLRTADGVPIMLENNFFPLEGFEFLLDADLRDTSIFDYVEKRSGRRPRGDDLCTLEVVRASSDKASELNVAVGEPLFYEKINFTDQNGKPFLIGKQYIVCSLYVFNI